MTRSPGSSSGLLVFQGFRVCGLNDRTNKSPEDAPGFWRFRASEYAVRATDQSINSTRITTARINTVVDIVIVCRLCIAAADSSAEGAIVACRSVRSNSGDGWGAGVVGAGLATAGGVAAGASMV